MKNILNWFVMSSADPAKVSLTVKAFIPLIIGLGGMFGFQTTEGELMGVVSQFLTGISSLVFLYGFGRKVYNTIVEG